MVRCLARQRPGGAEPARRQQPHHRWGNRGRGRASLLLQQLPEGAQIVALSDCNVPRAEAFKAKQNGNWPVYQDYRKVLDRKDIDAVIVATGEFQRVLPCIHACQAGKDVYAEKPLTLYVAKAGRWSSRAALQSCVAGRLAAALDGDEPRGVRTGPQRRLGQVLEVRAINYTGAER